MTSWAMASEAAAVRNEKNDGVDTGSGGSKLVKVLGVLLGLCHITGLYVLMFVNCNVFSVVSLLFIAPLLPRLHHWSYFRVRVFWNFAFWPEYFRSEWIVSSWQRLHEMKWFTFEWYIILQVACRDGSLCMACLPVLGAGRRWSERSVHRRHRKADQNLQRSVMKN